MTSVPTAVATRPQENSSRPTISGSDGSITPPWNKLQEGVSFMPREGLLFGDRGLTQEEVMYLTRYKKMQYQFSKYMNQYTYIYRPVTP